MSVGVCYPHRYAIEETIKFFKNPGIRTRQAVG
jgi:hypothetical protein